MPQKYTASKRSAIEVELSEIGLKSSRDTFLRTIGAIYGEITEFVPQFPSARTPRSFRDGQEKLRGNKGSRYS